MYLKRYHDITVSVSGIWRILKRLDMNRLLSSQRYKRHRDRWKRYEKPQPGQGAAIVGAVLLTTLAELGLTWLRIESEGLLGPVVLHAGINSVGALAAVLASRRSGRHQAAPTL